MPLITVHESGPPPEKDIADGVYPVILTELAGPKTIYPADKPQGTDIFDWTFAIDDDSGSTVEIRDNTSTSSGAKSKMYIWLTALLGKPPAVGQAFEAKDLVGRRALATVGHKASNWPYIAQLMAMPTSMLQKQFADTTGAPTRNAPPLNLAPAARPSARGAIALQDPPPADELPF